VSVETLLHELEVSFEGRKFTAGLMLAMIDFLVALGVPSDNGIKSYLDLIKKFPRQEQTSQGRSANTLIVKNGATTSSLRPFYNHAERLFRATHHRFQYPSCAPHATQAWADYVSWLDDLCNMSASELEELRRSIVSFVLIQLPDQSFVPGSILVAPPVFKMVLEEFDFTAPRGEPSGAAYQGAVFGFMRADNAHLQVEIDKVRTGSKRLQRVGDIDGWDGERLAITAEVKSMNVGEDKVADFAGLANEINTRGTIGLVVALSFSGNARDLISAYGLVCVDKIDLARIVRLWDPSKQRIAIESMIYYAAHVEKNSILLNRLKQFTLQSCEL
jgi:hypothetical protein